MKWICGVLGFLWFCPTATHMSQSDFEANLRFFSELDVVLTVTQEVCPKSDENLMQFKAIGHLFHDERLAREIGQQKIDSKMFVNKITTCLNECSCGALLTLQDKVSPGLGDVHTKKLLERRELLTESYYESCQKKMRLSCETKLVKEISKKAAL